MKDRTRISGGNGRSSTLMCPADYNPADFATFLADLKANRVYVDVTANNTTGTTAGVTEIGTALNKANLLSDTTASGFGFDVSDDPTVNDVLARIGADYITGTLLAGQTTLILTDARFKTTSMIDDYYETLSDGTVIVPQKKVLANGSLTITFYETYATNIGVKVRVM